ncbi:MAG: DUF177 domain-containing protein [Defluviicoccus sp.]|nr:DUF177 domain-containing protein [Defluviicoccus sp.]
MTPEFSRPVRVDRIPASGIVREIEAAEDERRALASRFAIVSIESLSARVALRRAGDGDIVVSGRCSARVVQECVVTLDPVASEIEEEIALLFRPVAREALDEKTVVISSREDFEPFAGESLDIGEVVAVELALCLDPFPRSPDADAATADGEDDEPLPEGTDSPFRALAARTQNG